RDTGGRQSAGDHADVQDDLGRQLSVDTHNHQAAEAVSGVEGQPIAPDDEQGEEDNDEAGADKPQLLTDNGEHKVVVLLGEEHVLLTAVAQPSAQQAAGTDGNLGLPQLIAVSPQVAAGVEPGLHT